MVHIRTVAVLICCIPVSAAWDFGFLCPDMAYREAAFGTIAPAPDSVIHRYSVTDEMRTAAGKWLYSIKHDTLNAMPGKDTLTLNDIINDVIRDTKTRFFYWDVDGDGADEYVDNGLDASWSHYIRIFKIMDGAYVRYAELPGYLQGAFTSDGASPVLITSRGFCCGDPVGWVSVNVPGPDGEPPYTAVRTYTSDVNMAYPGKPVAHHGMTAVRGTPVLTLPDAEAGTPVLYLESGACVTVAGTRNVGTGWVFCIAANQKGLVRQPNEEFPEPDAVWLGWVRRDDLR